MTTIARFKHLTEWLEGSQQTQRVQRTRIRSINTAVDAASLIAAVKAWKGNATNNRTMMLVGQSSNSWIAALDRFTSYREKIIPKLQTSGYAYFLSCDSEDYQQHQEWCNDHCQDHTLPHCDVWQCDSKYPRAFANKADAAMFRLTFGADQI